MSAKSLMFALLLPLLMLGSSARADDLRTAMEASNQQWLKAFNTPNTAAFPAMYTDDAVLIPGGSPVAIGPEAIKQFWEGAIKAGFKDHTFEIVETRADGNLAYLLSTWTVNLAKSGGEVGKMTGHTLRVLVKQNDGSWRTKVHTFIPQNPPAPKEAEAKK
jgi:uncharacterized protein (TIGR02246 family)